MNYSDFLDRVIEEGRQVAIADYTKPRDADRLRGSLEGFDACRGRLPHELGEILEKAHRKMIAAFGQGTDNYWRINSKEAEIEWVCNVVSAMLVAQGLRPIVPPTANGGLKAAAILNGEGCLVPDTEIPA